MASDVPVALWGLGFYGQDEWSVSSKLKVTLSLRFERNSDPVCQFNCFANFKGPWSTLASVNSANPGSVPYSSDIEYNQHQAYKGVDTLSPSPRIGLSYSPFSNNKTVFSGGFGIFYDSPAAGLVDDLLGNPPVAVAIRVRPSAGVLPFDPAGGAATWAASANAFNINRHLFADLIAPSCFRFHIRCAERHRHCRHDPQSADPGMEFPAPTGIGPFPRFDRQLFWQSRCERTVFQRLAKCL